MELDDQYSEITTEPAPYFPLGPKRIALLVFFAFYMIDPTLIF